MILPKFREFVPRFHDLDEVLTYLKSDLTISMRNLFDGLKQLSLTKNFSAFEVTVDIPASSEVKIPNRLRTMPTKRLIVRSNSTSIVDGDTSWTNEAVYLKNTGGSAARVTVIFMV